MAAAVGTARAAEQINQRIARLQGRGGRAGLARTASAVHLARCNPGDAQVRALCAPDRTVAIPNRGWGAGKGIAGSNHHRSQSQYNHRDQRYCNLRPNQSTRPTMFTARRSRLFQLG